MESAKLNRSSLPWKFSLRLLAVVSVFVVVVAVLIRLFLDLGKRLTSLQLGFAVVAFQLFAVAAICLAVKVASKAE